MTIKGNYHHSEETRSKLSGIQKGRHPSEETREKMSQSQRGKHHSKETRKKIGESNRGKRLSEEQRRRISEARKGEKNPLYGKHHTEETRKKISKAHIGKHHTEETRKKISEVVKGRTGILSHSWKGGLSRERDGRISLYRPDHPRAKNGKYVLRSHLVWEVHHGLLPEGFIIHHRNGDYLDDRIENLECITQADHIRLHRPEERQHRRT